MRLYEVLSSVTDIATLSINEENQIDESLDVQVYSARPYMMNLAETGRGQVFDLEVEVDRGGAVRMKSDKMLLLYIIYPVVRR